MIDNRVSASGLLTERRDLAILVGRRDAVRVYTHEETQREFVVHPAYRPDPEATRVSRRSTLTAVACGLAVLSLVVLFNHLLLPAVH